MVEGSCTIPNLFKAENLLCFFSSDLLQASEPEVGKVALLAASFLPKYLPHFQGPFLTSPLQCQKKKRIGEKGKQFHLPGTVSSGVHALWEWRIPKDDTFLQRWHFLSRLFLRSTLASMYPACSSCVQTTLLWLWAFNNSLQPGIWAFLREQGGVIPFQMIRGQSFLWIPLCSLKDTSCCLLHVKGHFTPTQTTAQLHSSHTLVK